jgi:hypothetical protein
MSKILRSLLSKPFFNFGEIQSKRESPLPAYNGGDAGGPTPIIDQFYFHIDLLTIQ